MTVDLCITVLLFCMGLFHYFPVMSTITISVCLCVHDHRSLGVCIFFIFVVLTNPGDILYMYVTFFYTVSLKQILC